MLPIPCKNAASGCKESLLKDSVKDHEEFCIYRKIQCCEFRCDEMVVLANYMEHTGQHKFREPEEKFGVFKTGFRTSFDSGGSVTLDATWLPKRLVKFGQNFFVAFRTKNGIFQHWIWFLGSPSEAKNYIYEASLIGADETKLTLTDQVYSLDEPAPEKSKFMLAQHFCNTIADEEGGIDLEIKLRNLKEEAQDDSEESGASDDEGIGSTHERGPEEESPKN